jgi:hypothetical protein
MEYVTKGGTTWQLIEARSAQHVGKALVTMTSHGRAKAVSEFLATAEGRETVR